MTKIKDKYYDIWLDAETDEAIKTVNAMFKAHKAGKKPHGATFTNLGLKRKK